jgi:hypothetical protein
MVNVAGSIGRSARKARIAASFSEASMVFAADLILAVSADMIDPSTYFRRSPIQHLIAVFESSSNVETLT